MEGSAMHFSPRPNRAHEIGWRPWSEASFEEAQARDRPIRRSSSAVWCHWCHVMDETTYSNEGVIELIKRDYLPIRVDNDERPDVNQRYNMGGWPTTAFLTPKGDILTGATYLPPEQMADSLARVASYYRTHQAEIATKILEGRKRSGLAVARSAGELNPQLVSTIMDAAKNAYDPRYGGFGGAPKFPQTDAILLLLEQAQVRSDAAARQMAVHTLEQVSAGGTYDHVEGGFFRYSTTQDWSVPHFEKMLEDHAGLVAGLALAGMTDVLDKTTGYLDRVLRDPETGLYAGSQDADERYYELDAEGRAKLDAPFVDRRVYSAWNAALATAYLDAAVRCDRPLLRSHAGQLLTSLFAQRYRRGEGITHADGVEGQLGDQVWGLLAAVRAHQHGAPGDWMAIAEDLAAHLDARYTDRERGGYFDRAEGDELGRLAERIKPLGDNSIAALALAELDTLRGDPDPTHMKNAERALESVAGLPRQYGLMAAVFARALDRLEHPPLKVTTSNPEFVRAALLAHPYVVIDPSGDDRAVVCVGTMCFAPVTTTEALTEGIAEALNARA